MFNAIHPNDHRALNEPTGLNQDDWAKLWGKPRPEGIECVTLPCPIENREHDSIESATECRILEPGAKGISNHRRLVAKDTAAPGAQEKGPVVLISGY